MSLHEGPQPSTIDHACIIAFEYMPTYFFFLGTNPGLSATEAYGVLRNGSPELVVAAATDSHLCVKVNRQLDQSWLNRLGGTDRLAEFVADWDHTPSAEEILNALQPLPTKWTLGLSTQGVHLPLKQLGVDLKKAARSQGSRLKFILPKGSAPRLNSAQVIFNSLTSSPHAELTLIKVAERMALARTVAVQDIVAYEERDTNRPARDAKVGILPPKLAQIMLNIATSHIQESSCTILDPFCGMGTILQEGWLMDHHMFGSDASRSMIEASDRNLQWLASHFNVPPELKPQLVEHDVRQPFPAEWHNTFDAIITEPYLGKPLHAALTKQQGIKHLEDVRAIHLSLFRYASPLLRDNGVILFLFPAVRTQDGAWNRVSTLTIDEIKRYGYDLVQLVPKELEAHYPTSQRGTLMYSRPDALVARELTLWKKR